MILDSIHQARRQLLLASLITTGPHRIPADYDAETVKRYYDAALADANQHLAKALSVLDSVRTEAAQADADRTRRELESLEASAV